MPVYPEYLYNLTARDMQVTPLEIVSATTTGSAAVQEFQLSTLYTVPKGKMLILEMATYLMTPGAAQTNLSAHLFIQNVLGGLTALSAFGTDFSGSVAALRQVKSVLGNLVLPEGAVISPNVAFSAGAATNQAVVQIKGILIPRGNFAI